MKKKVQDFWTSKYEDALFNMQLDEISNNYVKDYEKLYPFMQNRILEQNDDRTISIICTSYLEMVIDEFLDNFIPNKNCIITKETGIAFKLNLIRAFQIIPTHFINFSDCIKNIRNEFAHNHEVICFDDIKISSKLAHNITDLEKYWKKYKENMHSNYKEKLTYKDMYIDLWERCIDAFYLFNLNAIAYKKLLKNKDYKKHLNRCLNESN